MVNVYLETYETFRSCNIHELLIISKLFYLKSPKWESKVRQKGSD